MAKRSIPVEKIGPTLSPEKAKKFLQRQVEQINGLLQRKYNDPEIRKWDNITEQILIKAFGKPHENLSDFYSARQSAVAFFTNDEYTIQEEYKGNLLKCKKLLEGFIEQLIMFSGITSVETGVEKRKSQPLSRKVFIVHGHDDRAKIELALILTRLGLEPIILHEKPSEGMTLIEKLEKHSDVGFAFILLTPDDIGGDIEDKESLEKNKENLKPRARQNVVFEFGLFVGKLNRNRVCCLYKGDVELPSDLHGLVYIPFNSSINEKQLDIIKELRAAGYEINI